MQATSLANVCARHAWLLRAGKPGVKLVAEHVSALSSARRFCDLAIPGKFSKLSLNTFKSIAKKGLVPGIYAPAHPTQWEYFLTLLTQARDNANTQEKSRGYHREPHIHISDDEKIKQANLHAHLCALAFSGLFNGIKTILESTEDLSQIAKSRLQRQLDISGERFKHLSSSAALNNNRIDLVKDKP